MRAATRWRQQPPRLYAHRGAAAELPENTMPAFRRALELGAHAIELDVHMTVDGHIVVSHDPSGGRMAGVDREIRRCRLAEIKQWNMGNGFVDAAGQRPAAGRRYEMPTLAEVLEEFPDAILNLDLKQRRPSMVVPALELLRATNASDRVTVASFSAATLFEVRLRGYAGPTGMGRAEVLALITTPRVVLERLPLLGSAAQIPPGLGPLPLARAELIDKCHRLGIRVDFWTIDDPAEARRLLDLGADGIMTNDPARIAPVFDDYR